jgi:hypothetical protein
MNTIYNGFRGFTVMKALTEDRSHPALNPRFDLRYHSPDGYAWGYEGSGPAQLALALCCDVLEDDAKAQRIYQDFKRKWVAKLPYGEPWMATKEQLRPIMMELLR